MRMCRHRPGSCRGDRRRRRRRCQRRTRGMRQRATQRRTLPRPCPPLGISVVPQRNPWSRLQAEARGMRARALGRCRIRCAQKCRSQHLRRCLLAAVGPRVTRRPRCQRQCLARASQGCSPGLCPRRHATAEASPELRQARLLEMHAPMRWPTRKTATAPIPRLQLQASQRQRLLKPQQWSCWVPRHRQHQLRSHKVCWLQAHLLPSRPALTLPASKPAHHAPAVLPQEHLPAPLKNERRPRLQHRLARHSGTRHWPRLRPHCLVFPRPGWTVGEPHEPGPDDPLAALAWMPGP
jgi:hypothetical protein